MCITVLLVVWVFSPCIHNSGSWWFDFTGFWLLGYMSHNKNFALLRKSFCWGFPPSLCLAEDTNQAHGLTMGIFSSPSSASDVTTPPSSTSAVTLLSYSAEDIALPPAPLRTSCHLLALLRTSLLSPVWWCTSLSLLDTWNTSLPLLALQRISLPSLASQRTLLPPLTLWEHLSLFWLHLGLCSPTSCMVAVAPFLCSSFDITPPLCYAEEIGSSYGGCHIYCWLH